MKVRKKSSFWFHDCSVGEGSLQTKIRNLENIFRGRTVWGWLGGGRYANPLNGFSTSMSSFSSFSYCLMKVYVRYSYYVFQMSYSSTPVWKSIFYWERSVIEAKRKKDSFYQSARSRATARQEIVVYFWGCPWTGRRQRQRTKPQREGRESLLKVDVRKLKIGPPHPDCLNNKPRRR